MNWRVCLARRFLSLARVTGLARYITQLYEHWPPEYPPLIDQQDERHEALQDWLSLIERLGSASGQLSSRR